MNNLIISLLVCSLVFASGMFVFAEDNSGLVDNMKAATLVKRAPAPSVLNHRHGDFKTVIEQLVQEGKLSREKADQIEKYVGQKIEERKNIKDGQKESYEKGHKYGLIRELVNAKIINEAEAEAIKNKFGELREKALHEKLSVLVQKGTITQAQADKVEAYFENARKERVEQFKKLQNMTEEQRNAFFKEHKKSNIMNKLVEDGVLTKEQAKELKELFKQGHRDKCKEQ